MYEYSEGKRMILMNLSTFDSSSIILSLVKTPSRFLTFGACTFAFLFLFYPVLYVELISTWKNIGHLSLYLVASQAKPGKWRLRNFGSVRLTQKYCKLLGGLPAALAEGNFTITRWLFCGPSSILEIALVLYKRIEWGGTDYIKMNYFRLS